MTDQKLKADEKADNMRVSWGDWDDATVLLDFDKTSLDEVKYWAFLVLQKWKMEGFIIFESSRTEYVIKNRGKVLHKWIRCNHLAVFDRPVTWRTNMAIMNSASLWTKNPAIENYARMQGIKGSSTARFSSRIEKPPPEIVFRYGKQDRQIRKCLEARQFILEALEKMKGEDLD